jgi:hypothetical protein
MVSFFGNSFTVENVPFTEDLDVSLCIKKRKERLIYKTLSSKDNINISYVLSNTTTPQNNLAISDRSTYLVQNRIPSTIGYTTFTGSTFVIAVDKFLITDQFTTETPTQPSVPLFYSHTLRYFNSDLSDFSSRSLLSLEFSDYLFSKRVVTEYVTDLTTGKVYNNLENTYDISTTDFDVTYVKYTVRVTDTSTTPATITVNVYHELLDNNPIYLEADFEDLDEWGSLLSGHKVFLVETLPGGEYFTITLPSVDNYAYKEVPTSRIKALPPHAIDIYSPWYVNVTNGSFITNLQNGMDSWSIYKYYIGEFTSQLYDPYPPYKRYLEQRAVWLNENLVKVPSTNIENDSTISLFIDVLVKDEEGTLRYAYTNNPSKIDTVYSSSLDWTDGILSVDGLNGFIEVSDSLADTDKIYVTYYSTEEVYELSQVDFNPISNTQILGERVVVYVVPEGVTTGELDQTLYYIVVNEEGKVTYSSQAEEGSLLLGSTHRLLNEDFNSDGTPKHTIYYDVDSTLSGLHAVYSGEFTQFLNDFSFVDKYTVESILTPAYMTVTSGILTSGLMLQNIEQNPKFLLLADIVTGEAASPELATTIDVRVRGGGIKEESEDLALLQQPELLWNWDFNGRMPYPGAGSFYVEVPKEILTDYDGDFTLDQVRAIAGKHMQCGGYPVVRTYGVVEPVLTSGVVGSGLVTCYWPSYGNEVTYDINYSVQQYTGFTQYNSDPMIDNPIGNSKTMSGLATSTNYYVYVNANKNSYAYASPTYRFRTTT